MTHIVTLLTLILLVASTAAQAATSFYTGIYKTEAGTVRLTSYDKKTGKISFEIDVKSQNCSLKQSGDSYLERPGMSSFYYVDTDNKGKKTVQGKCDSTFTFDTESKPAQLSLEIGSCDSEHAGCKNTNLTLNQSK